VWKNDKKDKTRHGIFIYPARGHFVNNNEKKSFFLKITVVSNLKVEFNFTTIISIFYFLYMNVHLIEELSDSTNNINETQGINDVFVPQNINAFFLRLSFDISVMNGIFFFLKIQAKIKILVSLFYIHT
jgi:hypothetical protein